MALELNASMNSRYLALISRTTITLVCKPPLLFSFLERSRRWRLARAFFWRCAIAFLLQTPRYAYRLATARVFSAARAIAARRLGYHLLGNLLSALFALAGCVASHCFAPSAAEGALPPGDSVSRRTEKFFCITFFGLALLSGKFSPGPRRISASPCHSTLLQAQCAVTVLRPAPGSLHARVFSSIGPLLRSLGCCGATCLRAMPGLGLLPAGRLVRWRQQAAITRAWHRRAAAGRGLVAVRQLKASGRAALAACRVTTARAFGVTRRVALGATCIKRHLAAKASRGTRNGAAAPSRRRRSRRRRRSGVGEAETDCR